MSRSDHPEPGETARAGRHVCLPFETADEKRDATVSFIHEGLTRGNRCLFIGAPGEFAELGPLLEEEGICSVRAQARGALTFLTPEEAYLRDGVFDDDVVLSRIDALIKGALADGFGGLCATGAITYTPDDDLWRRIVSYEARVNEHFAELPLAALCRYPRAVVPPHRVRDVLRTHPIAVVRGETCDNPFYERPDLALSDDSQSRLDWQLHQLRVQTRAQKHLADQAVSAVNAAAELAAELEALRSTIRSGTG